MGFQNQHRTKWWLVTSRASRTCWKLGVANDVEEEVDDVEGDDVEEDDWRGDNIAENAVEDDGVAEGEVEEVDVEDGDDAPQT